MPRRNPGRFFKLLPTSLRGVRPGGARAYLHSLGGLQRLLGRDAHLPLPQELLGEVGDVPSGDGDVLYAAADDVAFGLEGGTGRGAVT